MKRNLIIFLLIMIFIGIIVGITIFRKNTVETVKQNIVTNSSNEQSNNGNAQNVPSSIVDIAGENSGAYDYPPEYSQSHDISQLSVTSSTSDPPGNKAGTPVLISFRIDDISFSKKQEGFLKNALYLAKKYDITFDLAVVARTFASERDESVYGMIKDDADRFELGAHGYNHYNNFSKNSGEFYSKGYPVPYDIQEDHIQAMQRIFNTSNVYYGTKLFFTPGHSGDNNTYYLARKYGYALMTQGYIPDKSSEYYDGSLIVSHLWMDVPMNTTLSNDLVQERKDSLRKFIDNGGKNMQIVMHPVNFYDISNSEEFIKEIVSLKEDYDIKFGFVSERLK
jgi:hypothetical protein